MTEKPHKPLTPKQQAFVHNLPKHHWDAQAAYKASGYSASGAKQSAYRLMQQPHIQHALAEIMRGPLEEGRVDAERLVQELVHIGFSDPINYFEEDGRIKPVHKMPEAARRAMSSIETTQVVAGKGEDAAVVQVAKIRFWDKNKALDTLAKHLEIIKDILQLQNPDGSAIGTQGYSFEDFLAALVRDKLAHPPKGKGNGGNGHDTAADD